MKIDGKQLQDRWVVMEAQGVGWWLRPTGAFFTKAEAIVYAKRYDRPCERLAVAQITPSCYIEDGNVRPCN